MNVHFEDSYFGIIGFLTIAILSSFLFSEKKLKYVQKPTISIEYKKKQTQTVSYGDSLFLVKTKQDIPLYFFKNVVTDVCFDSECRILKARIYWNITGRYLGFELPKGEFLSKHDHEPFVASEYEKLNDLLADPNLPLGNISFEKLIEIPDQEVDEVDGVSGATTPEVSKVVVKGAAYTTYTLWNIIYGADMDLVQSIIERQLTADLIELILESPDITDRVWVLNRIDENVELNPNFSSSIMDIISGDDFFLAYTAIGAIKPPHLDPELQMSLFSNYQNAEYSIKKMIIEKLMEAPALSMEVVDASRELLGTLNGQQLKTFLCLYSKFEVNDLETCKVIAGILNNENKFISQQAYNFLNDLRSKDEKISLLLEQSMTEKGQD